MKKTSFILFLLLSILNNAEFKENLLSKMIEEDDEEPILRTNIGILRDEAVKITRNLFGISYRFERLNFEVERVIHYGNPQITAKLSSKCGTTISMGKNSGSFQIKGGAVINKKGTNINLSNTNINYTGKFLNVNFKTLTVTLTNKLQGATTDGEVSFSFSPTQAQIQVTVTKSKGNSSCDGSITYTIKPGVNPKPSTQPAFNPQAIESAVKTVAEGGAIAVGAVLLFKLVKGVAGFIAGGPVLGLIGLAS